jgi:predicted kinase
MAQAKRNGYKVNVVVITAPKEVRRPRVQKRSVFMADSIVSVGRSAAEWRDILAELPFINHAVVHEKV